MVAWSIWNARNRFCFEKKQSQSGDILHSAMSLLQDYQRLTQHLAGQNHPTWWGLNGLRNVTSLYVNSGPQKCKTLWGFPCSFINEILSSVSKKKKKKKEEFMKIPFRKETQETVKEIMEEFHRPNKTNIKKKNCTTSTCKAIIYWEKLFHFRNQGA